MCDIKRLPDIDTDWTKKADEMSIKVSLTSISMVNYLYHKKEFSFLIYSFHWHVKTKQSFLMKMETIYFYFLLYTKKESIGFAKIFDFWFSMDLHVLKCIEPDLTIFRKCLSVRLQNFADTVSQELMGGNWWNFIFSCTFV